MSSVREHGDRLVIDILPSWYHIVGALMLKKDISLASPPYESYVFLTVDICCGKLHNGRSINASHI